MKHWKKHLPNSLTVARILLALVFPFAPESYQIPLILLALLTEFLDGHLARAFQTASETGQHLDPVADKLFFGSVCLTWISLGKLSWLNVVLLGVRDIGIAMVVLFLALSGRLRTVAMVKPSALGKAATVLQYLAFFSVAYWGEVDAVVVALAFSVGLLALLQYTAPLGRST